MIEFVENIKEKPEHIRKAYAFWLSGVLTAVVALFWVAALPARFAAITAPRADAAQSTQTASVASAPPLESLQKNIGEGIGKLKGLFNASNTVETDGTLETNAYTQSSLSGAVLISDPRDNPSIYEGLKDENEASLYTE